MIGVQFGEVHEESIRKSVVSLKILRVRVDLKVKNPLMRGYFHAKENEDKLWVQFKFERLSDFYYICGCLTHGRSRKFNSIPEPIGDTQIPATLLEGSLKVEEENDKNQDPENSIICANVGMTKENEGQEYYTNDFYQQSNFNSKDDNRLSKGPSEILPKDIDEDILSWIGFGPGILISPNGLREDTGTISSRKGQGMEEGPESANGTEVRMERLSHKLGFHNFKLCATKGLTGGIIMMWMDEVSVKLSQNEAFWSELGEHMKKEEKHWLLFGDLNEIMDSTEKRGGRNIWGRKLFLKQFLLEVGGIDLGFTGRQFTWERKVNGVATLKERLD
ncbi:hypothetical protein FNV43_RR05517 [Rhamnella rubrinervis]|uniref:Zinc knuckle CX2CX4HX4C domain-containing protein n=1 Tax=Rhamnella rubrinervis TaxID=2594499 RepID=A0A8K0HP62_9ROSA|nr:hypothetical protein FNV43_RR05517 [Rhamnella rubrinervis]